MMIFVSHPCVGALVGGWVVVVLSDRGGMHMKESFFFFFSFDETGLPVLGNGGGRVSPLRYPIS